MDTTLRDHATYASHTCTYTCVAINLPNLDPEVAAVSSSGAQGTEGGWQERARSDAGAGGFGGGGSGGGGAASVAVCCARKQEGCSRAPQ